MKIKKIILPLLLTCLLCGCGQKDDPVPESMYALKDGGTTLNLQDQEQAKAFSSKAKTALSSGLGANNLGLHFVLDNLEFEMYENVTSDYVCQEGSSKTVNEVKTNAKGNGKFDVVVNGLQTATKFEDLGAYVGIKDVNASYSTENKTTITGTLPSIEPVNEPKVEYSVEDASASVYLKDAKLYADLSNEGFLKAGKTVLEVMGQAQATAQVNPFEQMLLQMFGNTLTPMITIDPTGDETEYPLVPAEIKTGLESIDVVEIAQTIVSYSGFAQEFLTVKVYEDGSVGIALDVTKEKLVNLATQLGYLQSQQTREVNQNSSSRLISDMLELIEICNVKVAIVVNADGSINRIGTDLNTRMMSAGYCSIQNGEGYTSTTDHSGYSIFALKSYVKFNYNESISYPDLTKYVDSQMTYKLVEEDEQTL